MTEQTTEKKKVTLPVTGMTCATCAITVEKALNDVKGVSGATVNLAGEKATIEYDAAKAGLGDLAGAIADAGYGVAADKITFRVGGMTCASCVGHVEKALRELPGVLSVNVNLATEKATIEYLKSEVGMADFKRVVEDAGYQVPGEEGSDKKKVIFSVTGMTCASCVNHVEKALRELLSIAGYRGRAI